MPQRALAPSHQAAPRGSNPRCAGVWARRRVGAQAGRRAGVQAGRRAGVRCVCGGVGQGRQGSK